VRVANGFERLGGTVLEHGLDGEKKVPLENSDEKIFQWDFFFLRVCGALSLPPEGGPSQKVNNLSPT
tara:strand:+ start:225 stop:425 length:201 start_codon:yes stop_codon:yes gene_type:complete